MVLNISPQVDGSHSERKIQESAGKKKLETKLYKLLAEMVETERNYVQDLEQVCAYIYMKTFSSELHFLSIQACRNYLPLAGTRKDSHSQYQSLDRRKLKKTKRSLSQPQLSSVSLSQGTLNIEEAFGGENMESASEVPTMQ